MSNYSKIKYWDIANGIGIRTSIFFSGCNHKCHNCFNQELWDFKAGDKFNWKVYSEKIRPTINEHIDGISILGGEPMNPKNLYAVYLLTSWFKQDFPDKTIWLWSGYTYEELKSHEYYDTQSRADFMNGTSYKILRNIDVLVDGRFLEEQKDLTLQWCGSCNQRVIDMKKTLKSKEVVLYEEE